MDDDPRHVEAIVLRDALERVFVIIASIPFGLSILSWIYVPSMEFPP